MPVSVTVRNITNSSIQYENNIGYYGIGSGSSFPPSATTGYMFFRTDQANLYMYDGANWKLVQVTGADTTLPSSGSTGQLFYKTDEGRLYVYNSSAWRRVDLVSTGTSLPSSGVDGQLFYKTDNMKLYTYSNGAWHTRFSADKGTTFPSSPEAGDLFVRTDENKMYEYDGTNWVEIPVGAGKVLSLLKTVDGAGSGLNADLLDGAERRDIGGGAYAYASTIITLPVGSTTSELQAIINNTNHYIPVGADLIFQFEDGTFTTTGTLTFRNFYGGGRLIIQGNPNDAAGLSTAHSVTIDGSGYDIPVLFVTNNTVPVYVDRLNIKCADNSANSKALYVYRNMYTVITSSYFYATDINNARVFTVSQSPFVYVNSLYVSAGHYGVASMYGSYIAALNVDDTGTQPVYGTWAYGANLTRISSYNLNGSTADTITGGNGNIW